MDGRFAIWNIRPIRRERARTTELSNRMCTVLMKWLPFADRQFKVWPARPNCGHFFGGAYWYGFETAFTASVCALLASFGDYDASVTGIAREEVRRKAVMAIRYLGFTHDTGPDDCVRDEGTIPLCSGTKWGGRGAKFFPASQTGRTVFFMALSAWMLWDELDDETRRMAQQVVESYCDRWSEEEPRNGAYNDTQCEENAWTASGIAAGVALFPDHPRHGTWTEALQRWALNSVTTAQDKVRVKAIRTVTFHPDYTAENHGFLHPSYLCAPINFRGYHALLSLMAGTDILDGALYNNVPVYERAVKRWSQFDGLIVPLQGQDWWYNRHHERLLTHALMNVLHRDADAARLERNALGTIERLQDSNSQGCLLGEDGEKYRVTNVTTAKDMEHTSAQELVLACLLHLFGGGGVSPVKQEAMLARLAGVYEYPNGGCVVHRTDRTFSAFSWRNRVMALTLPAKGIWTVTPLVSSYTGRVKWRSADGMAAASGGASGGGSGAADDEPYVLAASAQRIITYEDGFGAAAVMARGDGRLLQHVAFISLPDGRSVYMERFQVKEPADAEALYTGLIGIRNENYAAMPELAPGVRTVYACGREERFYGSFGGADREHRFGPAAYVNVDDEIGYVLLGSRGVTYVNRREYRKWIVIEDMLILNAHEPEYRLEPGWLPPFVVLTLPNAGREATEQAAGHTHRLACGDECVIAVETDGYLAFANLRSERRTVTAERSAAGRRLQLFPGRTLIDRGSLSWRGVLEAGRAGYAAAAWRIEIESEPDWSSASVDVSVLADAIVISNRGAGDVALLLHRADGRDGAPHRCIVAPGQTVVHETFGEAR
jgi:hypothetical protein